MTTRPLMFGRSATSTGLVPARAARDARLSSADLRLLVAIAAMSDADGWCAAAPAALSAATLLSPLEIVDCLRELEARHYLAVERRGHRLGHRIITNEALWSEETTRDQKLNPQLDPIKKPSATKRLLRAWRSAERFQLWAKVVLAPREFQALKVWALHHDTDYRALVRRFAEAHDDRSLEKLLDDTQEIALRSLSCNVDDLNETADDLC